MLRLSVPKYNNKILVMVCWVIWHMRINIRQQDLSFLTQRLKLAIEMSVAWKITDTNADLPAGEKKSTCSNDVVFKGHAALRKNERTKETQLRSEWFSVSRFCVLTTCVLNTDEIPSLMILMNVCLQRC